MDSHRTASLDSLIAAVVGLGGPLTSILQHMEAFQASGRSAPDSPPIPEVLASLLEEVLHDLEEHLAPADLTTTAQVLEAVTGRICSEIHLVDPAGLEPRA